MMLYRRNLRNLVYLFALPLLGGCLTQGEMTRDQCANINWRDQGYQYGAAGKTEAELSRLASVCQSVGAPVDTAAYQQGFRSAVIQDCQSTAKAFQMGGRGDPLPPQCTKEHAPAFYAAWDSGLRTYCVPEFGFELGRSGGQYNTVCPEALAPAFKAAYQQGQLVFQQVQTLRQQTRGLRARLNQMEQAIDRNAALAAALQKRDPSNPEVAKLQQERMMLENQRQLLEAQLLDMQGEITRTEVEK